ncbi:LysR family transcriptional regulator [Noviherbaspirillum sp. CPCC 100848]|uniref:LysR family transcriptional regulator n=1 Tax=Noviherbaspirillum album TaxID=3080276 RepID=A0ABU6J2X2_9BURK|nr:LysR family transcriptional regulator [Noviherbaspirillum sp. CPCC 100848]MEC4717964.1 LysR family transcriptional regulator [Noviherbaspirillum sp. CPCC 100848]
MIDLGCVASYLAVASSGSFRAAALRVGLSQPAVTQQVKKLEKTLGATLIERGGTGSILTPEGRAFLPYAESLLRTSERALALFKRRGIVVGASSNIGVYLLPSFLKAGREHLGFEVDLVVSDNLAIASKLENFAIDVAVMEWWDNRPGFLAQSWKQEKLVAIVPPGHPWSRLERVPLEMLASQPMLGGEAGTGTGTILKQCLGEHANNIRAGMQLGSTEAVKRAVRAGLGVSIVMASAVAEEQRAGTLHAIPLAAAPLEKNIYLVRRASTLKEDMPSRFVRFLREHRGEAVPS